MILSPRRGGVASGGSTLNWVDHFNGGRSGIALMVDDRGGNQARGQFDDALCRKLKGIEDSLKPVILEASTDMSSGQGRTLADLIKTLRARAHMGFTPSKEVRYLSNVQCCSLGSKEERLFTLRICIRQCLRQALCQIRRLAVMLSGHPVYQAACNTIAN